MAKHDPAFQMTTIDVINLVGATKGFEVVGSIGERAKVRNLANNKTLGLHTSNKLGYILPNDVTRLKRFGWTYALWESQQTANNAARVAAHKVVEHRLNKFMADQGLYESPPPTRGDHVNEAEQPVLMDERGMKFSIRAIGPEEAWDLVDNIPTGKDEFGNRAQRPESIKTSEKYAQQMLIPGRWQLSPEPIVLLPNPETGEPYVMDGLRRMRAIQISKTTHEFIVAEGFPRETFLVINKGQNRTTAHTLYIKGYSDTNGLQSVVKACWLMDNVDQKEWAGKVLPDEDHIAYLDKFPEVVESMPWGSKIAISNPGANKASVIAAHFLIRRQGRNDPAVDRFFTKLQTGNNISEGDPIGALKRWFTTQRGKAPKGARVSKRALHMGQIIKAWNDTQTGAVVMSYTYSTPYTVQTPMRYVNRRNEAPPVPFTSNP